MESKEQLVKRLIDSLVEPKLSFLEKRNADEYDILSNTKSNRDIISKLIKQSQLLAARILESAELKKKQEEDKRKSMESRSKSKVKINDSNKSSSKIPVSRNKSNFNTLTSHNTNNTHISRSINKNATVKTITTNKSMTKSVNKSVNKSSNKTGDTTDRSFISNNTNNQQTTSSMVNIKPFQRKIITANKPKLSDTTNPSSRKSRSKVKDNLILDTSQRNKSKKSSDKNIIPIKNNAINKKRIETTNDISTINKIQTPKFTVTDTFNLVSPIKEIKEVKEVKQTNKTDTKKVKSIYIPPPKEIILNDNFNNISSYLNTKAKVSFLLVSKQYRNKMLSIIYNELNTQLSYNNKVVKSINDVSLFIILY